MSSIDHAPRPLVLDVSLRDGGYLNDWQFTSEQSRQAVELAVAADVDLIELGYVDDRPGLPDTAACPPEMLKSMRALARHKRVAAMIRPSLKNPEQALAKRQGLLDLLRIPVDLRQPQLAIDLALLCHQYGFDCTFNFTSVNCFSFEQLRECAHKSPAFLKAIYLADSRGAIKPEDVAALVAAVRSGWQGEIGYHAHNNLGFAIATSKEALSSGCTWLDASIAGVGLGGRNLALSEAMALVGTQRPDLNPQQAALDAKESAIGLSPPGDEYALYKAAAGRNLRMEWVEPLLDAFGIQAGIELIRTLPFQNWFEPEELKDYLSASEWRQIQWW